MSADLAVLVDDPGSIERAADPAEFVIQACERAKAWLRTVLDHGDIDQIAELKSQAEAIRVYAMQKQLGKDAQLSAAEIVRRAERGIGVAVRRGQDEGWIRRKGQSRVTHQRGGSTLMRSPGEFASGDELRSSTGIYNMTDGVSDDDFEEAISDARAEDNLSRANVVRKARRRSRPDLLSLLAGMAADGSTSRQIAARAGVTEEHVRQVARDNGIVIRADQVVGGTRRHDSNRIVRETASALEGLAMGVDLVDIDDLDPAETANWAASLNDSLRGLNRLARQLKEMTQ